MANVLLLASLVFLLGAAGVFAGVRLAVIPSFSKQAAPFSGGVLMGMAVFWVGPEIAGHIGWALAAAGAGGGFLLVWLVDRLLYPVCPTCSHAHHGEAVLDELHGMAGPLVLAAAIHCFFDGWGIAVSQEQAPGDVKIAFLLGISLHKAPEGIALGVLLLAATGSRIQALVRGAAVQSTILAGAIGGLLVASRLTAGNATVLLAVASGAFVYLGYHAIRGSLGEGSRAEGGLTRVFVPALTGAAGAAALRLVPGL